MTSAPVTRDIVSMMKTRIDQFGSSEKRVAETLAASPDRYAGVGLSRIAEAAGVSQPTVIRLCRKLGFDGFADFKVAFAQGTAVSPTAIHQDIGPDDSSEAVIRKVADSAISAISSVRDGLDPTAISDAALAISKARRLDCFCNGAAHASGAEFANKIYRLGIPCSVTADGFTQTILAATLQPGDVVLVISFSGEAVAHLEAMRLAKDAGATVIALTRPGAAIARAADISIGVEVTEDFRTFTPISTPLAFMVAGDALAMCAGRLRPDEVAERHALGKTEMERLIRR